MRFRPIVVLLLASLLPLSNASPASAEYRHLDAPFRSYDTGTNPLAFVLGDMNGDTRVDVVTADNGSNTLTVLLSDGDGGLVERRTTALAATPLALAVADFDADGRLDLAVGYSNLNGVTLHRGLGTGFFDPPTTIETTGPVTGVAFGRINPDALDDLVASRGSVDSVSVFPGALLGTFGPPATSYAGNDPARLEVADVDGNGANDLLVINNLSSTVSILPGLGSGSFGPPTTLSGPTSPFVWGTRTGCIDADAILDLAVSTSNGLAVYRGTGGFSFGLRLDLNSGSTRMPAIIEDLDGDGDSDLAWAYWTADFSFGGISGFLGVALGDGAGAFPSRTSVSTGLIPWGASLVDVNDDGRLDAVTMNRIFDPDYPGTISVLDGYPGAVFGGGGVTIPAPWGALSVSGADLDNDGLADLAVTTTDGCEGFRTSTITTRLGNGNATFDAPVTLNTGFFLCPRAMAAGRFNADPLADVAVTATSTSGVSIRSGTGGGAFGAATTYGGAPNADDVVAYDVDANGTLDLVLCDALGVSMLPGDGLGGFGARITSSAGTDPTGARLADMDANGLRDVVVVNSSEDALSVLPGTGGGGLGARVVVATGDRPNGVDIGELTGDAGPDLAVSCSDGTVRVHANLGGLSFGAGTVIGVAANPTFLQIADINGDGKGDILTADTESATVSLFLGNGDGTFVAPQRFGTGPVPVYLAVADWTGDGNPDVVSADIYGSSLTMLTSRPAISGTPAAPTTGKPSLLAAWPNPAPGALSIQVDIPAGRKASLGIFDVSGRRVRHLDLGADRSDTPGATTRTVHWNGAADDGSPAGAGVYFIRLMGAPAGEARRVVLQR